MNHSKLSVRTLTMLALLTAMSIIFARVLTVSTGFLRFNLGALPTHLCVQVFALIIAASALFSSRMRTSTVLTALSTMALGMRAASTGHWYP